MKLKAETIERYTREAHSALAYYLDMSTEEFEHVHVSISEGNAKIGSTPNFSLLPILTCPHCAACRQYCYAVRSAIRFPKNVMQAWAKNTAIVIREPERAFDEIGEYLGKHSNRARKFFRFHVAGDITSMEYLWYLNRLANRFPDWTFWTYTKMHTLVNRYYVRHGLALNLTIMYSDGFDDQWVSNPHGMPTFTFIPTGASIPNGAHVCGGNCTACQDAHVGCPFGQSSVVREH